MERISRTLSHLVRNTKGNGLVEYSVLSSVLAVAVTASVFGMGSGVDDLYEDSTWSVEEPIITRTGFVTEFKEQKVLGIAKDYEGSVTFIFEEAGYRNAIGMYKFDDEGTIHGVQIVFANASAVGSGGNLIPGVSKTPVVLKVRDQIGFFVASNANRKNKSAILQVGSYELTDQGGNPATITSSGLLTLWHTDESNGKRTAVRTQYAHNLFYSHASPDHSYAPNGDGYPHTVGFVEKENGKVTLGFEDLWSGGDNDYDDVILEFDIGRSNAAVLDPNLDYDYDGYDNWVSRLDLYGQKNRS
jgi:Flp pilus assembly pilin Flp